jgi:hypothetical protein
MLLAVPIVMVCVQVAILPYASVALYVHVMVSVGQLPDETSPTCVTMTAPQLSDAVPPAKSGGGTSGSHCTVTFGGHVIVGGVVSTTVMVCVQVAMLPHASVAFQVRVIVCAFPQPEAAESLKVTVGVRPQLSVAVAIPVADGLVLAGHCSVALVGHVITGGVVSATLTILVQGITGPLHPPHVSGSLIVNELHPVAITVTEEPVVDPTIVPFPVMDQL